jgi:hypothetical protein
MSIRLANFALAKAERLICAGLFVEDGLIVPTCRCKKEEVGSFLGRKNDSKQVLNQLAKLGGALGN